MNDDYEPYYSNNTIPKCGLKRIFYYSGSLTLAYPNDLFAIGISMPRKYAKGFIEKGTLRFGCAKEWIDHANKYATGKGDIQEGVFAAYELDDLNGVLEGLKDNPGSHHIRLKSSHSDLVYLVNDKTISLPTYCFHTLRFGDFKMGCEEGKLFISVFLSPRYFQGMADGNSWLKENELPYEEQHVFVIIYNPEKFIDMIFDAITSIGIDRSNIIYKNVEYKNIDIPFAKQANHPNELFIKNEQFFDQREGRIVVNVDNEELITRCKQPISVGSLEDMCILYDHYHAGGLTLNYYLDEKDNE